MARALNNLWCSYVTAHQSSLVASVREKVTCILSIIMLAVIVYILLFCIVVPPFQIQLVNGSPRVSGGSVEIDFLPTKPALSKCALDGRALDCM